MIKKIISFVCLLIVFNNLNAQENNYDSFYTKLGLIPIDSALKLVNNKLINLELKQSSKPTIIKYLELKLSLADSSKNKLQKHYAYEALIKHSKYLDQKKYFNYLYAEGLYQNKIGERGIAIDYFLEALALSDIQKNDTLKAKVCKRMGIIYIKTKDYNLALKYLNKSLNINHLIHDSIGITGDYMTLGNIYKNQSVFDTAMYFYNKSLNLSKLINYKRGLAGNYNNIGNVLRNRKNYNEALTYFFLALDINKKSKNIQWESYNYNNIGMVYRKMNDFKKAKEYLFKSQVIKKKNGDTYGQLASLINIADIYETEQDYKNALIYLRQYVVLNDSVANESKQNLASELEAKFENEKKEVEINKLKTEQALQKSVIDGQKKDLLYETAKRDKIKLIMYVAVFILLGLIFTIYKFWKNSIERKKHVEEINATKLSLTQKNEEITDSITYAKRIQAAILPSEKVLNNNLKQSFILYMPKDIVAGDFYWTEKVNENILFAVADCTGHGVPGALVSVVCNNALNSSIKQYNKIIPGEILDKTTDLVISQFEKSDENVQDGMDIAFCSFNTRTRTLKYAGANTPIWIVRGKEVLEFKANRQPVGNFSNRQKFSTIDIEVQENDMIYLSSDGFADQFGGDKGKKFKKKQFRELLIRISTLALEHQKSELKKAIESWMKDTEQVDDICVMGTRINA